MSEIARLGQYPTAVWVAEALVARHFGGLDGSDFVVEPACGPGAFLCAIPREVPAIGIDIDPKMVSIAREVTGREVYQGDFRTLELHMEPTVILGNPPFKMDLVDGFLDRAYRLLPEGGRCGLILPSCAFQTASRVAGYAEKWSLQQEMIPRNIFPKLSLPLVFAIFSKDRRRTLVGFALYRELADIQQLPSVYRKLLSAVTGSVWVTVVEEALRRLGDEADLPLLYAEIEGERPTRTKFWREQVRKVLRQYPDRFRPTGRGRYARVEALA